MSGEPLVTIVGNLGDDPELRFTPSGAAVCNFSIGQTPRVKEGDDWVDGEATWFRCNAWRELAENIAESLEKGTRVVVQGYMSTRSYEKRDGGKGSSLELRVEAIGPDLRWASAKVTRAGRSNPARTSGGEPPRGSTRPQNSPGADPWATPAPADPFAKAGSNDEPPF